MNAICFFYNYDSLQIFRLFALTNKAIFMNLFGNRNMLVLFIFMELPLSVFLFYNYK